jgi:hypothetical protein
MSEGWLDRVVLEHKELRGRMDKLHDFLYEHSKDPTLGPYEIATLMSQHNIMAVYADLLEARIDAAL